MANEICEGKIQIVPSNFLIFKSLFDIQHYSKNPQLDSIGIASALVFLVAEVDFSGFARSFVLVIQFLVVSLHFYSRIYF